MLGDREQGDSADRGKPEGAELDPSRLREEVRLLLAASGEPAKNWLPLLEELALGGPEAASFVRRVLQTARAEAGMEDAVLEDYLAHPADYSEPPSILRSAETASRWLVLLAGSWRLVDESLRPLEELGRQAVEAGRRLGRFVLRPAAEPQPAFQFAPAPPPIELSLTLADGDIRLEVRVAPEHQTTEQRVSWRFHLGLGTGSGVSRVICSVEHEKQRIAGPLLVEPDRPAEFLLDPPSGEAYRIHVKWTTSRGEEAEETLELPLLAREREEPR